MKRVLAVLLAACLLLATGCSSGGEAVDENALNVTLVYQVVLDEAVEAVEAELKSALPDATVNVRGVSMGDPDGDAMMYMGSMTKLAGMMAAHEIDLMICDADTARRYGDGGASFANLFDDAQLEGLSLERVGVALADEEGNLTGEVSDPCGVAFTGEKFARLTYMTGAQAFLLVGSEAKADAARRVVAALASE